MEAIKTLAEHDTSHHASLSILSTVLGLADPAPGGGRPGPGAGDRGHRWRPGGPGAAVSVDLLQVHLLCFSKLQHIITGDAALLHWLTRSHWLSEFGVESPSAQRSLQQISVMVRVIQVATSWHQSLHVRIPGRGSQS